MTSFRGRPSGSTRTRAWDDRDRRSMLLNLGFGLTIVAALLLLVVAFAAQWYDQHLSAAASVNGQTITKDELQRQLDINAFRNDYQARRIRTLLTAGRINSTDAQARLSLIEQRKQNAAAIALEQLIDGRVMADLAPSRGVTITDADIDARLTEEATTPELRHVWLIAVKPKTPEGASAPDEPAKAEAKAAAAKALADVKGGKGFEEVAKAVSTDPSKEKGGDLGFIDKDSSLESEFVDALFAAKQDVPTDVVEGSDGVFRIGLVTEIAQPSTDATLTSQVTDWGVKLDDFRAALRRDLTRTRLGDAILADALKPGPQREVAQIFLQASQSEGSEGAIKVRHILYSPKDDPSGAKDIPADDPSWKAAEDLAKATWDKLKKDPSQFDAIARAESDESSAATTGGKLPYFAEGDVDPAFGKAIFVGGLQPGQLLEPVKSSFGWHVIQVMHYPTDAEWAKKLKADIDEGTITFADAARDNSDTAEAAKGGDIGWVAKGQKTEEVEKAIFAAPIGKVSDPLTVAGEGIYLFLVKKEEIREPDAEQKAALKTSAFSIWYSKEKAGYTITRNPDVTGAATS